jgi:hypothetical protein
MRLSCSLLLLLIGSVTLAACSGAESSGGIRRADGSKANEGVTPVDPSDTTPPAAAACPATVPAAKAISTTETNATDVRILLGGDVIYRDGTKVFRVNAKGPRSELYASADLVHSFADDSMLVTIESPNPPDAVLKIMPVGPTTGLPMTPDGKDGSERAITPLGWNAGGTYVFASDVDYLYVMADVDNQGDTIYRVAKSDPNQMTPLAQLNATLTDPQLAGTDVWFVRDAKRVYRVATAGGAGDPTKDPLGLPGVPGAPPAEPTEVFGIGYANCNLAVGGAHAFCSTGKVLEQRDLSGANLLTVLDAQKEATPSVLGAATYGDGTVFVRTLPSSPTDTMKNGIRAVKTGAGTPTETLVACGRETITAIAVDATMVVWAERGKGVFQAPR